MGSQSELALQSDAPAAKMMVTMPRASDDDEEELDEGPSDEDVRRFSRSRTRPCQECGAPVHDEADICPRCHAFQWESERVRGGALARRTIRFAVVLAVVLTALALSGLLFVIVR
jgi:hypothetical protein